MPQVKGHNDKNNMRSGWLVINPYSQNFDKAIEVFRILGEAYKFDDEFWIIYEDPDYYQTCTLDLKKQNKHPRSFEDGYLEYLGQFYDQHKFFFTFPEVPKLIEIFISYLDGDIEMQEAIAKAQQIIDITSGEQSVAN